MADTRGTALASSRERVQGHLRADRSDPGGYGDQPPPSRHAGARSTWSGSRSSRSPLPVTTAAATTFPPPSGGNAAVWARMR